MDLRHNDRAQNSPKNTLSGLFPRIMEKNNFVEPRAKRTPLIVGHRSGFKPENTLLAFMQAREHGIQAVELDVWITADGQLAVIHGGNGGHIGHVHHWTDH